MAYPLAKFWLYPLCSILIKRIEGIDNIPDSSPFIIVSNHEQMIDPLYLLYPILKKLNKKIHFIASPTWWFLGDKICREWAGCIPLFDSKQAYAEAKKAIESGGIVGIFPEGVRVRKRAKGARVIKMGALRLSVETSSPILPIGIKSSYLPFNSKLNIGKPISLNKKSIKKQTIDLMDCIYKLRNGKIRAF